jgi:macrolide transport system ATP-binding/permease protein
MFWQRRRKDADFKAEVEAHIAMEADEIRCEGNANDPDAETAARREFGNVLRAQEQFYQSRRWLWLDHLRRDVAYTLRVLRRNPGFTTVAVISLALGIGVNALVFSVVNALVLRPLPVDHPEELRVIENNQFHLGQSFPAYRDLRDQNQVFSGLLGVRVVQIELDSNEGATRTWGYLATGNYFDVLGVRPALGRFFHQENDRIPGGSPYAVLSYATWQSRFAGRRNVLGSIIRINRQPYTIIGVAPQEFHGTEVFYWPEVWVPMMMQAQIEPGNSWLEEPGAFNTWVIGRLKPGITSAQATGNLKTIAHSLELKYPDENKGMKFNLSHPGLMGNVIGGPVRAFSFGVLMLAGLVLLTACANLASMVTARGADRQREVAIRLSVGATRWHVQRQSLTETVVLGLLGGIAGLGLAALLARLLSTWRAPLDFPVQFDVTPDWRVFLFAAAISVITGILFGLAPAHSAARTEAHAVLKGEPSAWRGRRIAFRDVLVVAQVAICFVLVSACMLSLRGLQRTLRVPLGFDPHGVTVAGFDLGLAGYTAERGRDFQRRALTALESLPGVQSAAYSNSVPLSIDENTSSVYAENQPAPRAGGKARSAITYEVSPNFLRTIGIQLLAGHDFTWRDDSRSPRVAIVNHAFGRKIFGVDNPLGKRFHLVSGSTLFEVVGVTEDGKYSSLTDSQQLAIFLPAPQQYNTTTTMIVRSTLPERELISRMRQTMANLDPDLPLFGVGGLGNLLSFAFLPAHASAIALSAFGILAIMLAVTGIYGLAAYSVAQRTHEIGIRVAIGAGPAQVVKLVLGRTFKLLAAGTMIGLVMALASTRFMSSVMVGVGTSADLPAFAAVLATIGLLGAISTWAPTRRALRIDPTSALRHE